MRVQDVRRVELGTFVRPGSETVDGAPRVEAIYGYAVRLATGILLLDTGIGAVDDETEQWYRPRRVPLTAALARQGVDPDEVSVVVNCHLHFDHIGGNRELPGRSIVCQREELETARAGGYTIESLVDFPGARYDLIDGETELAPGVHVIPTPGHVAGHQSLVVECADGSVVLAGQAFDTASQWSSAVLAARARELGHEPPLPVPEPWVERLLAFDPARVVFAHDAAIWVPQV